MSRTVPILMLWFFLLLLPIRTAAQELMSFHAALLAGTYAHHHLTLPVLEKRSFTGTYDTLRFGVRMSPAESFHFTYTALRLTRETEQTIEKRYYQEYHVFPLIGIYGEKDSIAAGVFSIDYSRSLWSDGPFSIEAGCGPLLTVLRSKVEQDVLVRYAYGVMGTVKLRVRIPETPFSLTVNGETQHSFRHRAPNYFHYGGYLLSIGAEIGE